MNTAAKLGLLFLLAALATGLSACTGGPAALSISSLQLAPGQVGTLTIEAHALARLQSLQIGPVGAITFDPSVIQVIEIHGVNGFDVYASHIDNAAGKVTVAAGSALGTVPNGALLALTVKAVGLSGSSTAVTISSVDVLADIYGTSLVGVTQESGLVSIQ